MVDLEVQEYKQQIKMEHTATTIQARNIKISYYSRITIIDSISNCKLSTIENIQLLPLKINEVKEVLSACRILVYFNTNNEQIVDFFKENFELYSIAKIPVGYNNGFQWHVYIKNNDSTSGNKAYLRDIIKEEPNKIINIEKIKDVLTKTLKSKRRKTDIVQEVIDNIK